MRKLIRKCFSLILAFFIISAVVPFGSIEASASTYTGFPSITNIKRPTTVTASQYSQYWQYWSAGASYYSSMASYGCRIVAYSKLLAESGIISVNNTNPDNVYSTMLGTGSIRAVDCYEYGSFGSALEQYISNLGLEITIGNAISLSGTKSENASLIMNYINQGAYIIVTKPGHTGYICRNASIAEGTPIVSDSFTSYYQAKEQCYYYTSGCAWSEIDEFTSFRPVMTTTVNAPSWTTFSSNKTEYYKGETVSLTFNSDTATYYNITILKNGSLESVLTNLGNTYSFAPDVGTYKVYMTAYNSAGQLDCGKTVDFVILQAPIPTIPVFNTQQTVFTKNTVFTINWSIQAGVNYCYTLYKTNGDIVMQGTCLSDVQFSLEVGNYNLCVAAYNSAGEVYGVYSFFVKEPDISGPTWANFISDDSIYYSGETATITFISDSATYYNLSIYRNGALLSVLTHLGSTYSFTPEIGTYKLYMTAYNSAGQLDAGTTVDFSVYGAPMWTTFSSDKQIYYQSETVYMTFESDTAAYYNITIFKNGSPLSVLTNLNGNYSFVPEVGTYKIFMSAYNPAGHIDCGTTVDIVVESNKITALDSSILHINQTSGLVFGISSVGLKLYDLRALIINSSIEFVNQYNERISDNIAVGTGIRIQLIDTSGYMLDEKEIVVFGDVNGDGNIDSIDAGTMVDYENYMFSWDPTTDAAYLKAGDLNGDGNVDSIDAGIAVDAENYLVTIDQTTGLAS